MEGEYCPLILTFLLHFVSFVNKKESQMHFCVDLIIIIPQDDMKV